MKKLLLSLSLLTMAISGCSNSKQSSALNIDGSDNPNIQSLAKQTILGFSSLDDISFNLQKRRSFQEDEIVDVKKALNEIDILLNNESKLIIEEITSTRQDYQNSLNLHFSMLSKEESFTLFYNEIKVKEEIEKDDLIEEKEVETSFKGIALYNNLEYNFTFSSEEEKEGSEEEKETTFKLFYADKSYIQIKQGSEEDTFEKETYYAYKVVENGKTKEEFKFKEETEFGIYHIKLEKGEKEYKVKYDNKDGKEILKVTLEIDDSKIATGYFERVLTVNEDNSTSIDYVYLN